MPLIKAHLAPPTASLFSMKDIESQARAMLVRAQRQAEQLLAEAQQQGEHVKEQARMEGLAEGRADGLRKGREEGMKQGREQALNEQKEALGVAAATLMKAAGEIDLHRRNLTASAVNEVIELAIAIAERVTKRMGLLDPSVAVANITEALKLVVHSTDVRIIVHPSQKQAIEELLPRLRMQWPKLQHVTIAEDVALTPGGARVCSGCGEINAELEGQLARIVADLLPEGVGRRAEETE